MRAGLRRGRDPHSVEAAVGLLDRHDRVRACRHHRAGHDPVRRAGPQRGDVDAAGRDVGRHRQLHGGLGGARNVGGPHRIAVHRGVVERGQRDSRDDVSGQHPAARLPDRDVLCGHRVQQRGDDRAVLVDASRGACHGSHPA
jgi:hypothetical protein